MARGDQFYPAEALEIRRLIGQSFITFFKLLAAEYGTSTHETRTRTTETR